MSSNSTGILQDSYYLHDEVVSRACDSCREKKLKCGGSQPPGNTNKCLHCKVNLTDCTYASEVQKRRRPKGQIERLKNRIRELETALDKLCPDKALLKEIYAKLDDPDTQEESTSRSSYQVEPAELIRKICRIVIGPEDDPFREEASETALMRRQQKISQQGGRFYGQAATYSFLRAAVASKKQKTSDHILDDFPARRRPSFWQRNPWELKLGAVPPAQYTFPPEDLLVELVLAYFENVNLFFPLLHRPTFYKFLAEGMHFRDDSFGGVLLLVCAIGARYTLVVDDRTLLDGVDSPYSAGWKWFKQVDVVKNKLVTPPNLYDIQIYALAAYFLQGTFEPHATWIIVGVGIRVAQDMGIHQRRVPFDKLTVEDELCKRAFWVLVSLDRMSSIGTGRSSAIYYDDMDLDMPIECDDEYWENEDPKKRFRQPPGKPSTVTAFSHQLRLNKIMAFAMYSVYHMKSKMWATVLDNWQQHIVEELDSALNRWLANLPDYLRWDPHRKERQFYGLSFMLMGWYHYVQILVHRPFIHLEGNSSLRSFPSLAICTTAARASINLVDAYRRRGYPAHMSMTLFILTSGTILSLGHLGKKQPKASAANARVIDDIYKCLDLLKYVEERWHGAGKAWDRINYLVHEHGPERARPVSRQRLVTPSTFQIGSSCDALSLPDPPLQFYTPPKTIAIPEVATAPAYRTAASTASYDSDDLDDSQPSFSGLDPSVSLTATTEWVQSLDRDHDAFNLWRDVPTPDDWDNVLRSFTENVDWENFEET